MRIVVDDSTVAHLWAHQSQQEAKNSRRSFYYEGDTIYSYGSHFPIAKHVKNKKGKSAVLFTTRGYSNTTSKHIHTVRGACNHLAIIYCHNPREGHGQNLDHYTRDIERRLEKLPSARKPDLYIGPAELELEHAKVYCKFFGIKVPKNLIRLIESAKTGKYKEYLVKRAKQIERDNQKRIAEAVEKGKKDLLKWRRGGKDRFYGRLLDRDYLRINWVTRRVQTTQGIEIPFEIAKRLHTWLKKTVKKGCGINGTYQCKYKVLGYDVTAVTPTYLHVGCHKIDYPEISKILKKLNWT